MPLDFLFIDGDHSWDGLKDDWECWNTLVSVGGIVALHDSRNRNGAGSELYTNEVILTDQNYEKLMTIDSLTILRRIA